MTRQQYIAEAKAVIDRAASDRSLSRDDYREVLEEVSEEADARLAALDQDAAGGE